MIEAVCVDPARVPEIWPLVSKLIKSAIDRGGLSDFALVEREVRSGHALLWLAWDGTEIMAAAVTELGTDAGRKICTIVACGGTDMERWNGLIGDLEQFAIDEGCTAMRIYGRRGWAAILPDYRTTSIVLEKELA